jgi:hypothetical protein
MKFTSESRVSKVSENHVTFVSDEYKTVITVYTVDLFHI